MWHAAFQVKWLKLDGLAEHRCVRIDAGSMLDGSVNLPYTFRTWHTRAAGLARRRAARRNIL